MSTNRYTVTVSARPHQHIIYGRLTEQYIPNINADITSSTSSGSSSGEFIYTATALENMDKGCPVYLTSSGVGKAVGNTLQRSTVAGFIIEDVTSGYTASYVTEGPIQKADWSSISGGASLVKGSIYFLAINSPGMITDTPPASGYFVSLGQGKTTDTFDIEIERQILT